MSTKAVVDRLPMCDIHKYTFNDPTVPAKYDGKTKTGPWANMCESCWKTYGIGRLGTGLGQELVVAGEGE